MKRILFALALCAAGAAGAQTLDADGDGRVTREELEAATVARFAAADADGNSMLDADELSASFADPGQLLYIVDADQDGMLNDEEWQGYASGAAAIAFMLCDENRDDALSGQEIACSQG